MKLNYSPQYYSRLQRGVSSSARAIVPVVMDLVKPQSVVDIGCGTGTWLAEFKRRGVRDILGVDGTHIALNQLEIDARNFLAADFTEPLRLRSQFDLAVSLEVAEHLQSQQSDQFVDAICRLAPVVLFSAAVPFQGGEHHVNEQWPAYWAQRFDAHDFVALDPFRRMLWERTDVDWWYAQNLVLFVRRDHAFRSPEMAAILDRGIPNFVHPRNYLNHAWQNRMLRVAIDLATVTRIGDVIILADENQFGPVYLPGRTIRPIVERNGMYFGPPSDGQEAIQELEHMQHDDADYFAIGWPAFWWLEHYPELNRFLEENHIKILSNEHVIMYRLES